MAVKDAKTEIGMEAAREAELRTRVGALAKQRVSQGCPYSFYFRDVTFDCHGGILTLRGRVPTFYLKQILQTLLRNIDGVVRIDNQVDVVSGAGLSSVRPK
jgi:hypothetical protein